MTKAPTLIIIDGSNNLYRSYYAIRNLTMSSGFATNAILGFTIMLRKLLKEQKPDAVAVAFDVSGATIRHKQFEDYKKDRKPMPDDLSVQIPFVYELVEAFGIPLLRRSEYEADDLIGSLAFKARDQGYNVTLATSDKDFFQLVGPGIRLYHTTREAFYDAEGVKEIFGLPPEQVVDVMAIWGDAIDNIPGVPGIGEKGAKALISEFGSLDKLYERLDEVKKPSHRKALETYREQALVSRDLARIHCDLNIDVSVDQLTLTTPDHAKLHDLFKRLEFQSLMQEYLPEAAPVETNYRVVTDDDELSRFLEGNDPIAFHLEGENPDGTGRPLAASLSRKRGEAVVVPISTGLGGSAALSGVLQKLFASARLFIAHDLKLQLRILGFAAFPAPSRFDDTMIMSYVLNPGLQSHTLDNVVRERLSRDVQLRKDLNKKCPTFDLGEACLHYLGEKSDLVLSIHELLRPQLDADPALEKIYSGIELPLIPVLARMEGKGIRIDQALLASMSRVMGAQIDDLEIRIYKEAGEEFNINSPTQLSVILFEKLKYPVLKKTKTTKSSSTGVEVLRELAGYGYKVPELILEHRELHKLKSTYVDALPLLVGEDGRVHTTFNQAIAATGRLSSSDPNLQNIPIRTQQGKEIRKAFIAEEGFVLLSADYSQIELRILAHMTKDQDLIDAFKRGVDIHRATASKIFGVFEQMVSPEQRRASKTINFGVLYGMSAFRLSNDLNISTAKAKEFIDAYFGRYPKIRQYLDGVLDEVRTTGKVTTLFGRVRYIPEIHNRSWTVRGNAERMATNAPIQGTAADLLKMAMISLEARLQREFSRVSMLLTVHDEIVMEVPDDEIAAVESLVHSTMESIYPLDVPLAVDTRWGKSWYEAKE